jgi:hypothetical protein
MAFRFLKKSARFHKTTTSKAHVSAINIRKHKAAIGEKLSLLNLMANGVVDQIRMVAM